MGNELGLTQGGHLCSFYQSQDEVFSQTSRFFQDGLELGQKLVGIMDPPYWGEITKRLQSRWGDCPEMLGASPIEWHAAEETYLHRGKFEPACLTEKIQHLIEAATADGYQGLRVTVNFSWATAHCPGPEGLLEYETAINEVFQNAPCTAMCQYDLNGMPTGLMDPLVGLHPTIGFASDFYPGAYADPIFHLGQGGQVIHGNPAAKKLFPTAPWDKCGASFFDLAGPGARERVAGAFRTHRGGAPWTLKDQFICSQGRPAKVTWKIQEPCPGVYSAYVERVEWLESHHHRSPCSFCAIDLVADTQVEVYQSGREEPVKVRFHKLAEKPGCYLLLAAAFDTEQRGQGCKLLQHLDRPLYEKVAAPGTSIEPSHWVEWVREQEMLQGITTPVKLWVAVWDTTAASMAWAGDGLSIQCVYGSSDGGLLSSQNRGLGVGRWDIPNGQDIYLLMGGVQAAGGAAPVAGSPGAGEIFQVVQQMGFTEGPLLLRARHLVAKRDQVCLQMVSQIGEFLCRVFQDATVAGWEVDERDSLLLVLGGEIMDQVQWDPSFSLEKSLRIKWDIDGQRMVLSLSLAGSAPKSLTFARKPNGPPAFDPAPRALGLEQDQNLLAEF